jgi:hypothetical protein
MRHESEKMTRLVERVLRESLQGFAPEAQGELIRRVVSLCEEQVSRERQRCVKECRRRAELWRTTPSATSTLAPAREEARARANEAQYLADLLEQAAVTV